MNIQIFGTGKCFDTKKAQRYFKERRIPFQNIDIRKYGISRGELTSVKNAVGLDALMTDDAKTELSWYANDDEKLQHLLDDPSLLRTPIVRNGKKAAVGYCPDVWKAWEQSAV